MTGEELDGVYYVESADGKKWERGAQIMRTQSRVIEQDGRTLRGPGDVTTLYHDTAANRFLGLIKFSSAIAAGPGNRLRSRGYVFTDRLDAPLDLTGLALPKRQIVGDLDALQAATQQFLDRQTAAVFGGDDDLFRVQRFRHPGVGRWAGKWAGAGTLVQSDDFGQLPGALSSSCLMSWTPDD